ncbi:MAG: dienelactone hydrolase family protein [Gammaproteobacteria bacterium]|jgi:carboxymethylenebutenolidase|nr:dienelactone hydrolase family protein [Gammaproteobacteria bacterium]HJP03960.1 dienelactone hydrolase family protein [Gammaproteobacteria bacterium]
MQNILKISIAALLAVALAGCVSGVVEDDELEMTMKEHGNDIPIPTPMASLAPAQPVSGEAVIYTTADGKDIEGWLARPDNAAGDLPALIVIHEWWGLNDNLRRSSERLAGEGYVTLAVDLHKGNTADTPKDAMQMGRVLSENKEPALANLEDAVAYLKNEVGATRLGVLGWCQGGRWSMRTALHMPDQIDATVIYYGRVIDDKEELKVLDMPVLGIFAGDDFIVPPRLVYRFATAMADLKKNLEFYMYRDASHAFSNPSGTEYNAEAAADAWKRTTAFLERNLK